MKPGFNGVSSDNTSVGRSQTHSQATIGSDDGDISQPTSEMSSGADGFSMLGGMFAEGDGR